MAFSPGRRQAIIWTNAGILLIGPLRTNFSDIFIGIQTFSFMKIHSKMSEMGSVLSVPQCVNFLFVSAQALQVLKHQQDQY